MQNDLVALKEKLSTAKALTIAIVKTPSLDTMAGALSLYLSLQSAGKSISLVCASASLVRDSHLVGIDKVKQEIGGQNLVITVNIEGDVVDTVTSSVDAGKLSLTVIPKSGHPAITSKDIVFGSSGQNQALTLVVGAKELSDLGEKLVDSIGKSSSLVNISNQNSSFGEINLVDPTSSLCELVTAIIQELSLPLSEDIAGNLMQGIEASTNNFQSESMTADTFEALAILYRAGARHRVRPSQPTATIIDNTPIIEERVVEDQKDIKAIEEQLHTMAKPQEDWLKPKIFTSSSDK